MFQGLHLQTKKQKNFDIFHDFIRNSRAVALWPTDDYGSRIMSLKKCCNTNPSHKTSMPRLNRAIGQLEGIKRMIEGNRYCLEILTQLRAACTAIKMAEKEIFKRHLESCVADSFGNTKESAKKIAEIKEMLDFIN